MDLFSETLRDILADSGIPISVEQLEKMACYFSLLEEANKSFKLTKIAGPKEAAERHFYDSLVLPALNLISPGDRVVDVGTGAGFPGVPIAILRANVNMTLLDSMKKRTTFLESAIQKLSLPNVTVVTARAEDYSRGNVREKFDVALSRAVAPLNVLLEYTLPFLRIGGKALAWKGPSAIDERIAAAKASYILGGGEIKLHNYTLPDRNNFFIVETEKVRQTPRNYPRKAGKPSDEPII